LAWFEKRHKSKTLSLAQRQISKAIETATQLESVLISILFQTEKEVDGLRRRVLRELATSSLEWRYREDLMLLIRRLDLFADWVKDSARSVEILLDAEVPRELVDNFVKISGMLKRCTVYLSGSIEMLGVNAAQSEELALKVDDIENQIDEEYLKTRALFIRYGREVNPGALIMLRDLLEYLERAADMCADTADYLRVLAVGG